MVCQVILQLYLVRYQYDIAGFGKFVKVHGKACLAGNSDSITEALAVRRYIFFNKCHKLDVVRIN